MPGNEKGNEREMETEVETVLITPGNKSKGGFREEDGNVPPLDSNAYSNRKTIAQGMMDLALLTSNASQLKMLLKYSDRKGHLFTALLGCLGLSIVFQVIVGVLLIWQSRYNVTDVSKRKKIDLLNNFCIIGIFLITVLNVLAVSFDEGGIVNPYDPKILAAYGCSPVLTPSETQAALPAGNGGIAAVEG